MHERDDTPVYRLIDGDVPIRSTHFTGTLRPKRESADDAGQRNPSICHQRAPTTTMIRMLMTLMTKPANHHSLSVV